MTERLYHHWLTLIDGTVIEYELPGLPALYGSMPLHLPVSADGMCRVISPHAIRDIESRLVPEPEESA